MGMLLIRYASGGVLPMRDVALVRYVWGSRMGANEMRMHTNGLWVEMPMMATRDINPHFSPNNYDTGKYVKITVFGG